jgi:uncharacterized protein HemY
MNQRLIEAVYWAVIFILAIIAGMALLKLSSYITNEKAIKILGIGITMWLIFMINATAMLLVAIWEWWIGRRREP